MKSTSNSQILIVDDNPMFNITLQTILEDEGYITDTATSGAEALEKIRENNYQVLFLDLQLPDVMGDEIANIISQEKKELTIIFLTGQNSLKTSIQEAKLPFNVLLKPVDPELLIAITKKYAFART